MAHCLEGLFLKWEFYDQSHLEIRSIWNFLALKRVILEHPCPASIQMVLYSCPYIEKLYLSRVDPDLFRDMMQYANWKNLRYLSIRDVCSEGPILTGDPSTTVTSFFDRHLNLESLAIVGIMSVIPTLPSSCLPKLYTTWFDNETLLTSFLSNEIISRLVHWDCPIDNIDANNLPQLDKLETLDLNISATPPKSFLPFLLKAPKLKKINLNIQNPERFYDLFRSGDTQMYAEIDWDEDKMYCGYHWAPLETVEWDLPPWGDYFLNSLY
ncbi:hypothetical protein Clacol_007069 [Clathrus columnatus]|uniref:Uncharacterized protein n=1 Tax=Clathrus columnatus TaxID=1419009 RepID=A0AAV5ADX2_9AGAM|nr:hypothetical protein Clacol_007069 [Clathrus columnatus]